MGEAKRKRKLQSEELTTAPDDYFRDVIDLRMLPPVPEINGARIRAQTGDETISEATKSILWAFRALAGKRTFHVGFCIGDGERVSPAGLGVIGRLMKEVPGTILHVVPVVHEDVA